MFNDKDRARRTSYITSVINDHFILYKISRFLIIYKKMHTINYDRLHFSRRVVRVVIL